MLAASEALTAFDWWSGIILPSVSGGASILLAGAALVVSIRALRQSNKVMQQTARRERAIEVERLKHLVDVTAQAFRGDEPPWTAFGEVSAAHGEFDRADRQGAKSVTKQLQTWLLHKIDPEMSPGMDKVVTNWVTVDIWGRILDGITRYLEDDSEQWRLELLSPADVMERRASRQ
ncbi:hypothetical protein [Curtobacterium sp. VKM Ac-1376]|uniref:hypothetical protein n=1 Tax=Curtobacterium sp. VKM Ac-1376 TaxID=123312 RepID=UPI001889F804|nr:hypothetical protein [Curtobacterium sp. VKM Ac-1376]MBF4616306.1 hypothetical protein [Curtobacterium sp. VKM Ac-1376]